MSYRVTIMPHVSADVDASYYTTPSEPDPTRLVPSAPASWRRVSTRTPPLFSGESKEWVPEPWYPSEFCGAEKLGWIDLQSFGEPNQLPVGHAPNLGLHLGQRLAADVPASELKLPSKLRLGQPLGLPERPQRRSNHVLLGSHMFRFRNLTLPAARGVVVLISEQLPHATP